VVYTTDEDNVILEQVFTLSVTETLTRFGGRTMLSVTLPEKDAANWLIPVDPTLAAFDEAEIDNNTIMN